MLWLWWSNTPLTAGEGASWHLWVPLCRVVTKAKLALPQDAAVSLLDTHPKISPDNRDHRDSCSPMFSVALFTTARQSKQQECPPSDKWVMKMWAFTLKIFSLQRKMKFTGKWSELDTIIQAEGPDLERHVSHIYSHWRVLVLNFQICICFGIP